VEPQPPKTPPLTFPQILQMEDKKPVASSIHDVQVYTTIQSQMLQKDMVLTELSLVRLVSGIELCDQGDSKRIDAIVLQQLPLTGGDAASV
jgi:hypothetical protein